MEWVIRRIPEAFDRSVMSLCQGSMTRAGVHSVSSMEFEVNDGMH